MPVPVPVRAAAKAVEPMQAAASRCAAGEEASKRKSYENGPRRLRALLSLTLALATSSFPLEPLGFPR